MTYTLVGNKDYIDEKLHKISKDFNEENTVTYNLQEIPFFKVIEDLNTISLFRKKLIKAEYLENIEEIENIEKYLQNESDNTLVLISYKELDNRKK